MPFGSKSLEEVSRSDIGKKIKEGVEEATKTARGSAESLSKGGEKLGRTNAFKAISQVRKRNETSIDVQINASHLHLLYIVVGIQVSARLYRCFDYSRGENGRFWKLAFSR